MDLKDLKDVISEDDKKSAWSILGRVWSAILIGALVFLITPGRIGQAFQALWNVYLQALGVVADGLWQSVVWLFGRPAQPGQPAQPGWIGRHRWRLIILGLILPLASWIFGAWNGGTLGRIVIVVGTLYAVAVSNLLWMALLLIARGGPLLVEMVRAPASVAIKGGVGVLRSIAPDAVSDLEKADLDLERVAEVERRIIAAVSSTRIVPLAIMGMGFWLLLFPSFTTLFVGVLIFFGGPALIHMGGLWGYETEWGRRSIFRWTKVAIGFAVAGIVFAVLLPRSADWLWNSTGGVDDAMVTCVEDIGECVAVPFRTPAPVISRQAAQGFAAADHICEWRFNRLQEQWNRGGMRFADYRERWARLISSCRKDRTAVAGVAAAVDRPVEDRFISALPILGWVAILALVVLFFRDLYRVRRHPVGQILETIEERKEIVDAARGKPLPQEKKTTAGPLPWWASVGLSLLVLSALVFAGWWKLSHPDQPKPATVQMPTAPSESGQTSATSPTPTTAAVSGATAGGQRAVSNERIRWVEENGAATCPELMARPDWRRMHDPRAACRLEGVRRQFAWLAEPAAQ